MRLFIAISVPESLRNYCRQLQNHFPEIKKTKKFHITLQFLGDDIDDTENIIASLRSIDWQPFEIRMGDALPFGKKKEPRGVWIECRENKPLKKLVSRVQKEMQRLGYNTNKPFKAHITLGRYKKTPKKIPEIIRGKAHKFRVDEFKLFSSHLSKTGSEYKTLARFKVKENCLQRTYYRII